MQGAHAGSLDIRNLVGSAVLSGETESCTILSAERGQKFDTSELPLQSMSRGCGAWVDRCHEHGVNILEILLEVGIFDFQCVVLLTNEGYEARAS